MVLLLLLLATATNVATDAAAHAITDVRTASPALHVVGLLSSPECIEGLPCSG